MNKLILISLLVACGATTRQKTLNASLAATDTARSTFITFDLKHQRDILSASKDKPTADLELGKYRIEQTKVEQLLADVYRAIALAATVDNQPSLDNLEQALIVLVKELKFIGVSL